ncbi:MAG TPA: Hsp20/alpha crystallin family protein [Alphaproteobacteria bacterium]
MSQTTDTQTSNRQTRKAQGGTQAAQAQAVSAQQQQQSPEPSADTDDLPTFLPPADIFDTDQAIQMLLDVPGADPDGLDITLEKRVLSVFARSRPFEPEGYMPLYAEYQTGNYRRAFVLSDEVDREKICPASTCAKTTRRLTSRPSCPA